MPKISVKSIFSFLFSIVFATFVNLGSASKAGAQYETDELTGFINEGVEYHKNQNYIQAIQSFGKALNYAPENKDILENLSITHNNYGKYLAERTDGAGAAREFRNALYYDSNNNVARTNLNAKLKSLELNPDDYQQRILYAKDERDKGNLFAAIAEAKEANRLKPSIDAYLEIGEIYNVLYLKNGRTIEYAKKAVDNLSLAQQIDSKDVRPLIKLGDVYIAKNEITKGIEYYEQAIREEPQNPDAQKALINGWLAAVRAAPNIASNHVGLATAYQLQGNFSQAERGFRKALEIDPRNDIAIEGLKTLRVDRIKTQTAVFLKRALELQQKQKYDDALAEYIKALNLEPNNADIHYNIGTAFQAKADFVRAEKAYKKTLELRPKDKDAEAALANLISIQQNTAVEKGFKHAIQLQESGKAEEAIRVYNAIAADRPDDDTVYYNLGTAYQAIGNLDKALENYELAYEINKKPQYKEVIDSIQFEKANKLLEQGVEEQSRGDNQAAIISYESVIELFPKNASAWYNLATAFQALNKNEEALNAYKKAFAIDEKNQSDAIFFAAILLEEKRDLVEAISLYEKYLKVAPSGGYAKDAKQRQDYIKSFL